MPERLALANVILAFHLQLLVEFGQRQSAVEVHGIASREFPEPPQRGVERGFTPTLTQKDTHPEDWDPGPLDRFPCLRLIAYLGEETSQEANKYISSNAGVHYTDEEWQEFDDEKP